MNAVVRITTSTEDLRSRRYWELEEEAENKIKNGGKDRNNK